MGTEFQTNSDPTWMTLALKIQTERGRESFFNQIPCYCNVCSLPAEGDNFSWVYLDVQNGSQHTSPCSYAQNHQMAMRPHLEGTK